MSLIEFQNYIFSYPSDEKATLDNINLTISEGEFVLVCGPSGCGKTTLIKQLIPGIAPYGRRKGKLVFDHIDLLDCDENSLVGEVGYVGQSPSSQIITDKVWHELAFGMENLGLDNETMERRIAEICEFFGMQSWINRDVDSLSGGEMQMVHLAAVMVMEPKVLILDEPIAQLDPLAARNFLDMLSRINAELGTTIILVEHHLEDAYAMASKVVAMSKARIDYIGSPGEVAGSLKFRAGLPTSLIIAKGIEEGLESVDDSLKNINLPLTVVEGQRYIENVLSSSRNNTDRSKSIFSDLHLQERNDYINNSIVLKMKEIAFSYDNTNPILNDCSLNIYEGEIFALMGGNGTGKSTLLSIICQSLKKSYGSLEIFGDKVKDIKDAHLGYKGMVYLPQDPMALFTQITVREELLEAFDGLNMSIDDKNRRVEKMIEDIGFVGLEKMHPYDLSYGQMQLLAFAKLLLLEPGLILMDEPTKGLDYDRKIVFGNMLKELSSKNVTILLVSHDIEFCARFATRCGLLHDGKVVASLIRHEFFAGNRFFTTASNRISRRFVKDAILPEEVITFVKEKCKNQEN